MTKQLIIVVHGVGVKEAGVSADLLATALDDKPEDNSRLTRAAVTESRLRPHSSDDFQLRELQEFNYAGKRRIFPARIRRYRHNSPEGTLLDERVVADFYWGDISNIASGLIGLVFAIVKTILGLSHIIRENAWSVFPTNSFYHRFMRRVANGAALVIHGPIAAINVFLLIGVACGILEKTLEVTPGSLAIPVTAVLGFAFGGVLNWMSPVYLTQLLARWLMITAVIFLAMYLLMPLDSAGLASVGLLIDDLAIKNHVCSALPAASSCMAAIGGLFMLGLRLIVIMNFLWVMVLAAAIILTIAEAWRALKREAQSPPSLLAPAITLMTLLWIILIGAIWAVIVKMPGTPLADIPLDNVLGMLTYSLGALVMIALAGGGQFVLTRLWAKSVQPSSYINPADASVATANANKHRLIMAPAMLWTLRAFLVLVIIKSLFTFLAVSGWMPKSANVFTNLDDAISDHFGQILGVMATIAGIAAGFGQAQLRAGLGIAIDVITWLNDHDWNTAEAAEGSGHRNNDEPLMKWLPTNREKQGYWRRHRIKSRLEVLADQLIRDEQPDELYLISHSQGTVVALDVLADKGRHWLKLMGEKGKIRLVTMGSPYVHVHRHYFPRSFREVSKIDALAKAGKDGCLTDWINIFRIDDFVGTHIDPAGMWPREHPVPANGHTYYWIDENVFPILKGFVETISPAKPGK